MLITLCFTMQPSHTVYNLQIDILSIEKEIIEATETADTLDKEPIPQKSKIRELPDVTLDRRFLFHHHVRETLKKVKRTYNYL